MWVYAGAAIIGGTVGYMANQTEGGDFQPNPYGQLNPEQVNLTQQMGPQMQALMSQGSPQYTGDYTAQLSPGEQWNIDRQRQLAAMGYEGLEPLLQGEFPEDYYQQSVYKPMLKSYTEDIAPLVEEQYAGGSGGYWGSARAGAVGKGYRDLTDTLTAKRSELAQAARMGVPNAINALNALSQQTATTQGIPRAIKQYGLEQKYAEWKRTRPENYISQALTFLGLRTREDTYSAVTQPNWAATIGGAASGVGSMFGASGGGGSSNIQGGQGGTNTGTQNTPQGNAPTWSPYDDYGNRVY